MEDEVIITGDFVIKGLGNNHEKQHLKYLKLRRVPIAYTYQVDAFTSFGFGDKSEEKKE